MTQVTTHDLWTDGRAMSITAVKPSNTSLQLTWTIPTNPKAYAGAVVLVSEAPLTALDFPVDGTRYSASSNFTSPADKIGNAQVVAAFYGFFGDAINQTTVTVTNLDPDKLYYASIHAASNILQYYTLGVQSYPLEVNDPVQKSSPYAGSIPQAATPPQNPFNGQIYFDVLTSAVLVWNSEQQAWIKANQTPVPVGAVPNIDVGQLFYLETGELKFFDGTTWVAADSGNLRVKIGPTWAPFTSITSVGQYPQSSVNGDFVFITMQAAISAPQTHYVKFSSLGQWLNPTPDMVQVFIDGTFRPITQPSYDNIFGSVLPFVPNLGDFFYNTTKRELLVWAGTAGWVRADTAQQGVPMPDKVNVGTDGSSEARRLVMQKVKTQMGYPKVCVELDEANFDLAIENALSELRRRVGYAYELQYISFTLRGASDGSGQMTYYLNDPRDQTDKVVDVLKIHRINQLGISSLSAESGLYAQAFFNQLYQGSNVDVLSLHLMSQLSEVYEKIFAGNITFTWNEARRELKLLRRTLQAEERVVLEVMMERPDQELINDRYTKMWIQNWAYAEVMEMLGNIRSKYGSLPGAQGGLTLNGDSLLARATDLKSELIRQVNDYEVGNGGVEFGNTALLIG